MSDTYSEMIGLILAAGRGARLNPLTQQRPKCLLEVHSMPLLRHALAALRAAGVGNVVVAVGHLAEQVRAVHPNTELNPQFMTDNILGTFYACRDIWRRGTLCCYGDILFDARIVSDLIGCDRDICVVVDRNWQSKYVGRTEHPIQEAELALLADDGRVIEMSKGLDPQRAAGEFIGMLYLSSRGACVADDVLSQLMKTESADALRRSYLTHFLSHLAHSGCDVWSIPCRHPWHEIDTLQDLNNATRTWKASNV